MIDRGRIGVGIMDEHRLNRQVSENEFKCSKKYGLYLTKEK